MNSRLNFLTANLFAGFISIALLVGLAFAQTYPKIDVSGFKRWEYRQAEVDPKSNYFLGITHLGGFSPTVTGGPWQERLQLKILAQLNEKLSVSYDVQQQPESPDQYDIKVNYDNKHELTFGDFTANFSGNEFTTVSKYLNGMMITSKDEGYNIIAVPSAKLKSQVQSLTKQTGNNTKGPYSLGHGSLVEGSERIELNKVLLVRGVDYIIDYLEGKITFTRILTSADEFTYSFEYTNIMDLFFPALSKKDFFGLQGRFKVDPTSWGKRAPEPKEVIESTSEVFPTGGVGLLSVQPVEKPEITPAEQERLNELEFKAEQLRNNIRYLYSKVPQAKGDRKRTQNLKKLINEARKEYAGVSKEIKILATFEAAALVSPATAEARPAPIISESREEILEEESSGRYRLRRTPVITFSETLTYRGQTLRKNEEYTIKYDEGLITLLLPTMPSGSDPLTVSYSYPRTELVEEILPGIDSRGPYILSSQTLVPRSEKILINDRIVVRDYDYYIDYNSGRLMFNYNVSSTSAIKARYRRRVFVLPPPPPPKYKPELTVGMTYLKESAKKSVGAATADIVEAFTTSQISSSNNTIYLTHLPMLNKEEQRDQIKSLIVRSGGVDLVEGVDYAVPSAEVNAVTGYVDVKPFAKLAFINDRADRSDGYATSTIKVLTASTTAEITILYTYKKTIVGRFTADGDGGRGPYYIKNYVNVAPGTEVVEVWDTGSPITTKYVRNSSFEADAGDLGYSINYYKDSPYLTFNKELPSTKNFSVTFQYVPPTAPTGGDMSQDVTGFDADFKYGELLGFSGNYARSRTDQVIPQVSTIETIRPTASTNKITLNSPGSPSKVVDGSEKVFVNDYLRNRDIDYIIDYTQGVISFYYIMVSSEDTVRVEYSYPGPSGVAEAKEKADSAYKYSVSSKLGDVSMAYNAKKIGFDFNPLGGTAIGVGSNYQDFSASLAPQKLFNFSGSAAYNETNNPFGNTRRTFTRNYNRTYQAGLNPFNLVGLDFNLRNNTVLGDRADPTADTGPYTADSEQNNYSLSATPLGFKRGIFSYDHKYDGRRTLSENRLSSTKNNSDYFHMNHGLGITERVKVGWDYAISEPVAFNILTGEVETTHSLTRDNSYDLSVDLTFPRVKKWTTYVKLINHQQETRLPSVSFLETKNTTYHMDLTPLDRFSTTADYNRQETPSVVTGGKNPMTERTATNVRVTPIGTINTGWAYSEDHTVHETGRESKGRSNNYTADWAPIQTERVKFNTSYSYFYRTATTPLGTLESNTDTNTLTQNYDLTLTPHALLSLTPGFTREDYQNTTDGAKLESTAQTSKLRVTLSPYSFLSSTGDYSLKVTSSGGNDRHKSLIGTRTGWRLDWGEVVWNLDEEENKGEVQAGGAIPPIDYKKTTNTFSLNFNVPQDNPILSGILLTASYKLVNFINNLRAPDNFKATMLTFEGTLNF